MRIIRVEDYMAERAKRMSRDQPLQGYAIRPGDLLDDDLMRCVDEAARRGLAVDRGEVERAYEHVLDGRDDSAARVLGSALYPNGGDRIAAVRNQSGGLPSATPKNGKGHVT